MTQSSQPSNTPTLAQLRQQLQQLKELADSGAISGAAYEESRAQLEKRVLDLVMSGAEVSAAAPVAETAPPALAKARPSWKLLATGAAVMLAIGTAGYLWKGHPEVMGGATPVAPMAAQGEGEGGGEGGDHAIGNEQFQAMVAKLAERLKNQPNDAEGWAMLGRSYNVLGRLDEALVAYRKSYAINPNDPSLLADLADAVAIKNNRSLAGEPLKLARRALELDPKHVKALALVGTEAFERKDYAGAVKLWERAVAAAPADSDMAQQLQGGIAEARRLGNLGPAAAVAPAPLQVPQQGGAAAALAGRDVRGTVRLAGTLASKASPDDTVFIFARPADGSRMPLAILRKQVRDLPFDFTLDDSLSMSPAARLSQAGKVIISARVSKSGQAMPQPGDLSGQTGPVDVGSQGLRIEISEVLK
jgi:cytochrome c-type biogenesis protein CcmH